MYSSNLSPMNKSGVTLPSYTRSPINYNRTPKKAQEGGAFNHVSLKSGGIGAGDELDLWKSRCNELESSLCQANTDLELANFRARKAHESDNKIDELIRMNQNLSSENESIQRQSNQRKSESDIWRQKYETQMNNVISMKSNYELESKRVNAENARLRDELKQCDIDKVKESEDVKYIMSTDKHEKEESLKK